LKTPRNVIRKGKHEAYPPRVRPGSRLFSYHTRYYLRRRAWRYFRRMAFKRAKDYTAAVAMMLERYTDADVARGEHLLDSWSLIHACFFESDVLEFTQSLVKVKEGRSLAELKAAPQFEKLSKE